MKQIRSIGVTLKKTQQFFWGERLYIFVAFWKFFMSENLVFGFSKRKNFLVAKIYKCLLFCQDQHSFVNIFFEMIHAAFFLNIKNNNKK